MNARILICTILLAAVTAMAGDKDKKTETVRVLVFDSGTKPAAALNAGKWETRTVGKDDPSMMCKNCSHSRPVTPDKPAILSKRNEAYLCSHCHNVVYLKDGVEVDVKDKDEKEAFKAIKKELKKDSTTKPAASVNTGK